MNDQAANLRRKIELLKATKQAKTIAVVSGKGGVGKSNFALNFSISLAKKNKKVLVFDLDIGMGNIDILMGLSPKQSIVNMFTHNLSIHDIIELGPYSLSYVAAGSGLQDIFTVDESKFNYFLAQLEELTSNYDYIVFDMGAGVAEGSIYFTLSADECIVVTTPEPTALTDAYAMIKHITGKQFELPIYLLVNRAHDQKMGQDTLDRLKKVVNQFLKKEIKSLGILPEDKTVFMAVSRQTPYVIYDPKALVSKTITQLAEQYLSGKIDINKKVPYSFINKLKHLIKER